MIQRAKTSSKCGIQAMIHRAKSNKCELQVMIWYLEKKKQVRVGGGQKEVSWETLNDVRQFYSQASNFIDVFQNHLIFYVTRFSIG
jgi:hypothetical protein